MMAPTQILVILIPAYLIRLSLFGLPTNVFEVAVGIVFLVELLIKRQSWRQVFRELPNALVFWLALFLAAVIVSTLISSVPLVSLGILKSWIVAPLLLAWLVYAHVVNNPNYRLLVTSPLIYSGLATSLLSLSYYIPGERLAGIYDVPNSLALWLAPIILLAIMTSKSSESSKFSEYSAVVMFLVLLLTQSVVGIAVVLLVLIVSKFNKSSKFGTTALAVFTVLALFTIGGRLEYFGQHPNSLDVRMQLWSVSWDVLKEKPLLGVGLGQFEPAYQEELHQRFAEYELAQLRPAGERGFAGRSEAMPLREFVFRDPHNWVLSFWLNTGLLGLVGFIGLNGWLFWLYRKSLITNYRLLSPILVILIFGLFDTIFWKNDLSALYFLLVVLTLSGAKPRIEATASCAGEE